MKIGIGYDIHPLVPGRKFLLGGVEIPFSKGPQGHSDGDPLLHAVCDALLGAAGLGDMGKHFSDEDPKWKGADSSIFLRQVAQMLEERHLAVENIDANLFLETPKLAPYLPKMVEKIASLLQLKLDQVNLKAKRGEGLGPIGEGQAAAAQVLCLLRSTTR